MKTEIGMIMVFATLCFLDAHVVTPAVSRAALEGDNWRAATNETEEGYNEGYNGGLSADQILDTDFEPEFADDNRTIDEIIAAAGTAEGAALVANENGEWSYCEPESESTNPQTVKVQVTGSMPVEVGCFKNFCWRRSHQSQEWLSRFQGAWWAYVQSAAGYYVDCENALECKQYGAAEMKIKGPWKRDFQQPQPSALPRFGDKKLNREK